VAFLNYENPIIRAFAGESIELCDIRYSYKIMCTPSPPDAALNPTISVPTVFRDAASVTEQGVPLEDNITATLNPSA
jgi:hypothetical protein